MRSGIGAGMHHRRMAGLLLITALASVSYAGVEPERSAPREGRPEPPVSAESATLPECAGSELPVNPDPPDPPEDESLDACIAAPTSSETGMPKVPVAPNGAKDDRSDAAKPHRGLQTGAHTYSA